MVMEPHEKVFSVDAYLTEKSLLAVVADSASIHTLFSLLSTRSNPDLAGLEEKKTYVLKRTPSAVGGSRVYARIRYS